MVRFVYSAMYSQFYVTFVNTLHYKKKLAFIILVLLYCFAWTKNVKRQFKRRQIYCINVQRAEHAATMFTCCKTTAVVQV